MTDSETPPSLTAQMKTLERELAAIYKGFEMESGNGVVCSIPDEGLDAAPHRFWCVHCQKRYRRLKRTSETVAALTVQVKRLEQERDVLREALDMGPDEEKAFQQQLAALREGVPDD